MILKVSSHLSPKQIRSPKLEPETSVSFPNQSHHRDAEFAEIIYIFSLCTPRLRGEFSDSLSATTCLVSIWQFVFLIILDLFRIFRFADLFCSYTSSCKVCRALRINSRLNALSFSGASSGLPVGLTMPPEAMARSEPTSFATGIIVQICVTGISSFSISLLIAAPQRVLEPHVEVRITPVTPADLRRAAIA